jgi:hypothetical protein
MMVAIPGMLLAHVAKRWRNEYVAFLARLEGITLRHFRPAFGGLTQQFVCREVEVAEAKALTSKIPMAEPALA